MHSLSQIFFFWTVCSHTFLFFSDKVCWTDVSTVHWQVFVSFISFVLSFNGCVHVSSGRLQINSRRHLPLIYRSKITSSSNVCMQQATSAKEESFDTARLRLGDTRTPQQIADEFQQLIQEGIRVAAQTPPRVGITRSLQAARALLLTGVEFAQQFQQRGSPPTIESLQDDAPVILRKLFERLGSTVCFAGRFLQLIPAPRAKN